MFTMSSVSIDRVRGDPIRHEDSSCQSSGIPPAFACIRVNLVVDGDVGFTQVGLFVHGPKTRFGGRSAKFILMSFNYNIAQNVV